MLRYLTLHLASLTYNDHSTMQDVMAELVLFIGRECHRNSLEPKVRTRP